MLRTRFSPDGIGNKRDVPTKLCDSLVKHSCHKPLPPKLQSFECDSNNTVARVICFGYFCHMSLVCLLETSPGINDPRVDVGPAWSLSRWTASQPRSSTCMHVCTYT